MLKTLAAELAITEFVQWRGNVDNVTDFYRAADIFVSASRHEGAPNALLEAMSCDLPAIVTDGSPGPLEYVDNGVNGLVVPVNDADQLAAAMLRLASDADLRLTLAIAARTRIAKHDHAAVMSHWQQVMETTL